MRDMIRRHSYVFVGLAGVVVVVSLWRLSGYGNQSTSRWFMDMNSGKLFAHAGHDLPPITAPSGGEGVLAHVFSCADCTEPKQRVVGYIEKFTPEGKAWIESPPSTEEALISGGAGVNSGHLVRAMDDNDQTPWVPFHSPQGMRIVKQIQRICPDDRQTCRP